MELLGSSWSLHGTISLFFDVFCFIAGSVVQLQHQGASDSAMGWSILDFSFGEQGWEERLPRALCFGSAADGDPWMVHNGPSVVFLCASFFWGRQVLFVQEIHDLGNLGSSPLTLMAVLTQSHPKYPN